MNAAPAPTRSVVVPVYNERATIEEAPWRIQQVEIDKELILVDDGSTDGTRELLKEIADAIAAGLSTDRGFSADPIASCSTNTRSGTRSSRTFRTSSRT